MNDMNICQLARNVATYDHVKLGVNIHNFTCKEIKMKLPLWMQRPKRRAKFLPQPSTTGSADTRLSTKMLSALMMGVFGWMKAMSRYVPMPSSLRVCFMKAGFGISHI